MRIWICRKEREIRFWIQRNEHTPKLFADRLADLPFQLTFKIIVFLSYRRKMEYNCCRVSISVFQNWIV